MSNEKRSSFRSLQTIFLHNSLIRYYANLIQFRIFQLNFLWVFFSCIEQILYSFEQSRNNEQIII